MKVLHSKTPFPLMQETLVLFLFLVDLYSTPWSYCNADFIYNLEKLPTKMSLSLDMNFLSVPIISSDHGAHVHQWPWGWKVNRCPIILSAIFQQSRNSLYRLAYKVIFVKPSGAIFVLVFHKSGHVKNTSEKQWLICKAHVWPVFNTLCRMYGHFSSFKSYLTMPITGENGDSEKS